MKKSRIKSEISELEKRRFIIILEILQLGGIINIPVGIAIDSIQNLIIGLCLCSIGMLMLIIVLVLGR